MADDNGLSFIKDVLPVLGPVGSIASGLLGFFGQKSSNRQYLEGVRDTNATNLAIARETNKQNLDMFNAANAFSESMWNKQNKYNNPASVRARLLQAGISPSAMAEGGTAGSVQSVSGNPAVVAHMQAPERLPSPVGELSARLGGSVSDFQQNLLLNEQIKQSKLISEMKYIDASYYLQEKSNQIVKQIRDLDSLGLSNREKETRLNYLTQELEDNALLRRKMMRAADDEHDNAIATGRKLESETNLNNSSVARNLAEIQNMSVRQSIDWFEAHTNRQMVSAQVNLLNKQVENLTESLRQSKENFDADTWFRLNKHNLDRLGYDQQQILLSQMQQELQSMVLRGNLDRDKASGFLNDVCRRLFGFDLENIFSGSLVYPVRSAPRSPAAR